MPTDSEHPIPDTPQSPLSRLRMGLLILTIKQELAEPEHSVMGRVTFAYDVVQKRYSYAGEIERTLDDLKLTAELMAEVTEAKTTKHKTHQPEELLTYYAGVYLDHVHQLKDKLIRLLDYMMAEGPWPKPYDEPKSAKISKLTKKHPDTLAGIGILPELERWGEDSDKIGVALGKRTQYHHFINRLRLNTHFLGAQMSRTMLQPTNAAQLSDYGVEYMSKLGKESFIKLKDNLIETQASVLAEMEASINTIATKLIEYYDIPVDRVEQAKVVAEYTTWTASLEIKNEAKIENVPPSLLALLGTIIDDAKKMLGERVVSIYLVGSAGRTDFDPGLSDVNIIVITKDHTQFFPRNPRTSLIMLSESDFMSETHKKDRFICWSDGILLMGKPFKFRSKDFPKPGTLLAMLLNRGIMEKMEALKAEISALKDPTPIVLREYSVQVCRMMLDFAFGAAMANKPYFTSSRNKRIEYIQQIFPKGSLTALLASVYKSGAFRQSDLIAVINTFLANNRENYQKMLEVEAEVMGDDSHK